VGTHCAAGGVTTAARTMAAGSQEAGKAELVIRGTSAGSLSVLSSRRGVATRTGEVRR
jgi:hypothetical protein